MDTRVRISGAAGLGAADEVPVGAGAGGPWSPTSPQSLSPLPLPTARTRPPATVLVCDGLRAVAESLADYLQTAPGLAVHGVATAAAELLPLLHARRPHLLVLDATLPGPDPAAGPGRARGSEGAGGSLVAAVRLHHPETRILMIGPAEDADAVARALRDGALGWVTVDASAAHLVEAAHGVLRGEYRIAPTLLAAALGAGTAGNAAPGYAPVAGTSVAARGGTLARLSERERLVLSCLVGGMNRRDIATRLGIAETTARTHIGRILIKLDAHSMVEAAAVGRRAGLSAVEL